MILLSLLLHLFKGTLISHWRVITKTIPKQSNRSPWNFKYVAKRDGICPTICKRASSVLQDTKHTALLLHSLWQGTEPTDGRKSTYKRSAIKTSIGVSSPQPREMYFQTYGVLSPELPLGCQEPCFFLIYMFLNSFQASNSDFRKFDFVWVFFFTRKEEYSRRISLPCNRNEQPILLTAILILLIDYTTFNLESSLWSLLRIKTQPKHTDDNKTKLRTPAWLTCAWSAFQLMPHTARTAKKCLITEITQKGGLLSM